MLLSLVAAVLFVGIGEESVLRSGCSPDDPAIAALKSSDPVEIKFRIVSDGHSCFKVATPKGDGYLRTESLQSSEAFEKARLMGAILAPSAPAAAPVAGTGPGDALAEASRLLESSEPARALTVLEPLLKTSKDPQVFALAGLACYRTDDVKRATDYWKESLDMRPNPPVQRLYDRAVKELSADRSSEKKFGGRFILRYDGQAVSENTARQMVALLEEDYGQLTNAFGCNWTERITAVVQSPSEYRRTADAPNWSAGRFDGRIRIALLEGDAIGPQTRRVFMHELTHACVASIGQIPIWLHEGLAQKMSGDVVTPAARRQLRALIEANKLPRVDRLTRDWLLMDEGHAAQGYLLALAATDILWDAYTQAGVRTLLRNPEGLQTATKYVSGQLAN